jgi:hypothetical protein
METRTTILIEEVDRATRFAYSTLSNRKFDIVKSISGIETS